MKSIISSFLLCACMHLSVGQSQLPSHCQFVDCMPASCPGAYVPPGECCERCPDSPDCSATICLRKTCPGAFVPEGECCAICPSEQCATNPCLNGGKCRVSPGGDTMCMCAAGYTGEFCESKYTPGSCLDLPCQNGGSCTDLVGTYVCECELGFSGKNCEIPINKPTGVCPTPKGFGLCAEMCPLDGPCPGGQLCCSNGCGHQCMDPVQGPQGCFYKGQWYKNGESFKDQCNTCRCTNGVAGCTRMFCYGCTYKNKWYNEGATFKDDCNTCTCSRGRVACTEKACFKPCFYKGKRYMPGESVKEDCNTCTCSDNGLMACTLMACPKPCVFNGIEYQPGETFQLDCNTCTCRENGQALCTLIACTTLHPCATVRCGRPLCDYPVKGLCCLTCDQGCYINGTVYAEGELVPCNERCGVCVCQGGNLEIRRRPCPPPPCPNAVTPPGRCCPKCPGHGYWDDRRGRKTGHVTGRSREHWEKR